VNSGDITPRTHYLIDGSRRVAREQVTRLRLA